MKGQPMKGQPMKGQHVKGPPVIQKEDSGHSDTPPSWEKKRCHGTDGINKKKHRPPAP